jgi:vacuolar protein sorting-associated protein 29
LKIGFTNGYQIVPRNDPLSLLTLARELDVDILIWGGTHKVEAYTLDGKFFINPGSITGAFSFDWPEEEEKENENEEKEEKEEKKEEKEEKDENEKEENENKKEQSQTDDKDYLTEELSSSVPSFCLLDVRESGCTVYIYTYLNDEVKVDKVSYLKE